MERLTITSFGTRPINIAEIQAIEALENSEKGAVAPCDKWAVLRDLNVARSAFRVSDRDLAVLSALLSFHPDSELDPSVPLIVFPSNRKLAERAHGMAESTLRRHLAALVKADLIHRHDSPNGKRYVRRGEHGEIAIAFGFDLSPLAALAGEIADVADQQRAAIKRLRLYRERVSLKLRDAAKLLELALDKGRATDADIEELAGVRRALRRKSSEDELTVMEGRLQATLERYRAVLERNKAEEMDATDSQTERHYHNSKPDIPDIEPSKEKAGGRASEPPIPLALVVKACPEISLYASGEVRSWNDLFAAAAFVRGMLGISEDAWTRACHSMGTGVASIVVACILQRYEAIHSPGGYLRALTDKAEDGAFSPGPMVMALLSSTPKAAAS